MAVFQLIYVSLATRPMTPGDLVELLTQSRDKNARLGITGLLVYHNREFMQLLEGERAPLWDARSRGAFAGMSSANGAEDFAAAVMEGVAFSARLALEAIERSGNRTVSVLRHGGGGAASDTWCQIRADALGRRLDRVSVADVGAMGALVIAATAAGTVADLAVATEGLVSVDRAFEPDPARAALADTRFEAFKELYQALGPVNDVLHPPN